MSGNVSVRQDILTSWQRCVVAGLRPDHFEVPYQPDFDDDGPLRWAAGPILDQVAGELEGTGVGLLLTDARGQVVDRRAADTGILTRLDRPDLQRRGLQSAAAPVRQPRRPGDRPPPPREREPGPPARS